MAQSTPRVLLLWAVMATTALSVVECTCHEQGSDQVTRPVITSVVANQASAGISEISINWTDENDLSHVNRYAFFFGLQTNDEGCISAGTLSKSIADIAVVDSALSATVHHTLDPFVRYTVQVAQDWPGSSIGRKSIAFNFTLNATLDFDELANKSIQIEWPQPARTSNITGFVWEYSTEGLEEFVHKKKSSPLSPSVTSAMLDSLEEGACYRISVKVSTSNPTVESAVLATIVKTPPGIPAKPQKLTAKEGSPVIALSWQAPPARDRNGDIIAYKIRYTSPSKVTQTINVKVEAYESRRAEWNYTILEVQRGVKYTVEVAAATEAGTGDYTVTEVTTTPLPPPVFARVSGVSLTNTVASGIAAIIVNWTTPQSDVNISQYQVEYRKSGTIVWDSRLIISGSPQATSTTLTGLEAGTEYSVRVRAMSAVGPGEWSVVQTERTFCYGSCASSRANGQVDNNISQSGIIAAVCTCQLEVVLVAIVTGLVVHFVTKRVLQQKISSNRNRSANTAEPFKAVQDDATYDTASLSDSKDQNVEMQPSPAYQAIPEYL